MHVHGNLANSHPIATARPAASKKADARDGSALSDVLGGSDRSGGRRQSPAQDRRAPAGGRSSLANAQSALAAFDLDQASEAEQV